MIIAMITARIIGWIFNPVDGVVGGSVGDDIDVLDTVESDAVESDSVVDSDVSVVIVVAFDSVVCSEVIVVGSEVIALVSVVIVVVVGASV